MNHSEGTIFPPTAIIIGAGGQDGRLLSQLLKERGTDVIPVRRGELDSCVREDVLKLFRSQNAHEIYYLAAHHQSAESHEQSDPAETFHRGLAVHANGVSTVLEAMRRRQNGDRLFYAASSLVFAGSTTREINELTPMQPNCPYGISKAAGVEICRFYRRQYEVFATCGFLFNHESHLRPPTFLSRKIAIGAARASLDHSYKLTLGSLDTRVDWTYAPDMVEAITRTLTIPHPSDFVMCTGESHSVAEFAEAAFQAVSLDWQQHVQVDSSLLQRQVPPLTGDPSTLQEKTGWLPSIPFEEWIAKMVHFEIRNTH